MLPLITASAVRGFAPHCDAPALAAALDAQTGPYRINTGMRIAHWVAQMAVECAWFTQLQENLNYSDTELMRMWPQRFNIKNAHLYAHNPVRIANRAYGGRFGNGDEASGDGWRYRGRGFLDHSFRDNYAELERETGLPLLAQPDLLLDPVNAAHCAAEFWATRGCNALADENDLQGITRRVNGGLTGLVARQAAFSAARRIWNG